jgi:hypothetical protein
VMKQKLNCALSFQIFSACFAFARQGLIACFAPKDEG